ncbi:MAG: ABC transporter ATP-binding protein, partial [Terracidiphilus sp.]
SRRLLPLISQISFLASQMDGSYENVKIVDSELRKFRSSRTVELPIRLPDAGMVMQMIQVSFSYRGGAAILQNVNLYMEDGEAVVLFGASGIGKSSLLNLIAGVSQPQSGSVRVDRTNIAYVPQEIPLLDDSIRNNLLFGLPDRNDDELMRALSIASLDEFVSAQPLGLDTGVGDNGALFSGGERQRLGLARAILRGGRLLLLDEATSALDEETERQVLENLISSGRAILLATHRVHARAIGDRVFRLEEGSLIEEPRGQVSAGHSSLASVLLN